MGTEGPESYRGSDGNIRRWKYRDNARPDAACYDCGKPYRWIGDCVVADDVWERINPTDHQGGGLLCANCMLERLHVIELSGIRAELW